MTRMIKVQNKSNPDSLPISAKYCDDFWSKFRGLMLQAPLQPDQGALLVEDRESKVNASIHMFLMRFDICVIWLNNNYEVVDVKIARRWRPAYLPANPARYVLETHVSQAIQYKIGDQVSFTDD